MCIADDIIIFREKKGWSFIDKRLLKVPIFALYGSVGRIYLVNDIMVHMVKLVCAQFESIAGIISIVLLTLHNTQPWCVVNK